MLFLSCSWYSRSCKCLLFCNSRPHPYSWLENVFVYTVEGTPNLEQVIPQLKLHGIKHVTMMPFMMVAGDHANNDMAGNEPDSHKSILEKEGFKVDTYLHGLGENQNIRNIFVERANEAWDALQK